VARAAPDGYTITVGIWNTHVANGITYALQYDVVSDFEPIALLADASLLFLGKKDLPANSLKELIGWLKENPDKASMGSTGVGGPRHLLALLLQEKTGTRFNLVPYRGVNPSVQDLIAGQIDMTTRTASHRSSSVPTASGSSTRFAPRRYSSGSRLQRARPSRASRSCSAPGS
jgi:tripartite-type tricarboxylate transporter receptor subunit TctC